MRDGVRGDDAARPRGFPGETLDSRDRRRRLRERALDVALGHLGLDAGDEERGRRGDRERADDGVADERADEIRLASLGVVGGGVDRRQKRS